MRALALPCCVVALTAYLFPYVAHYAGALVRMP